VVTEIALLNIKKGSSKEFEDAFAIAQNIIASMRVILVTNCKSVWKMIINIC